MISGPEDAGVGVGVGVGSSYSGYISMLLSRPKSSSTSLFSRSSLAMIVEWNCIKSRCCLNNCICNRASCSSSLSSSHMILAAAAAAAV